jgi:hypothetical protein
MTAQKAFLSSILLHLRRAKGNQYGFTRPET